MKVVIDLDQHQAIQDFGVAAPAGPYQWKSQDTIDWMIYFVRGGIVQDLGAGLALKYGCIVTGDATDTILAYQTAFTYQTDSNGNIYYLGQVVYNTSQMASAISGKSSINCTSEIRYQTSDNEIIHSLNISSTVFATILVETGVTPPGVSTGYPDASTIELLVHKNVASGYAGLNASAKLSGAQIPVDTQTIVINSNSQLASAAILTTTTANFTTPAANAIVSVAVVSSANLKAGSYIRIPIAGYYIVSSITDATDVVLTNNGDPFNAASGTTITSGAVLLPAQAAAGGGSAGANAYTTLSGGFTMPAVGGTVSINVASTAWMGAGGYNVFISGAGYFSVNSVTDTTHAVVSNLGGPNNQAPASSIPAGGTVTGGGPSGPQGVAVAGVNAYDAVALAFIVPAVNAAVTVTIGNTAWMALNQTIYIATAGYYSVSNVVNATQVSLTNLGYPGNATAGASIAVGSKVSPGGLQGIAGTGGTGRDSFTTLSANYTQPIVNGTVSINVATTAWMIVGQAIYVFAGGYYTVQSVTDISHAVAANLGYTGNAAPGAIVTGSGTQGVGPAGLAGQGGNSFTTIGAAYTQPAVGSNVTVTLASTAWMVQNQYVFINGGGTYQVVNINDATHVILQNVAATGNVTSGSTVPIGSGVSPSGPPGPQGATGIQGPSGGISEAPTDGQLYGRKSSAWSVISTGGGGLFDPTTGEYIYDDFNGPPVSVNNLWQTYNSSGTLSWINNSTTFTKWASLKVSGIAEVSTGTGASGGSSIVNSAGGLLGAGTFYAGSRPWGLGALTMKGRVIIEGSLPATGVGYLFRMGMGYFNNNFLYNIANSQLFQNCMLFEYSPDVNSGSWVVRCGTTGAGIVATNSSVAVNFDTAYDLEIDINAAWTSIVFVINGTTVATFTSNIPTGTGLAAMGIYRSSGSANYVAGMDYFMLNYSFNR